MQFVIDEAEDGYFWVLKGPNGKVICVSEHVDTRQACVDTIAAIRQGVPEAVTVDNTIQWQRETLPDLGGAVRPR